MKAYQKAIELLQQRLKNIDDSVNSVELEQLANAVAAIAKLETSEDILNISDKKLAELLAFADAKIAAVDEFGIEKQAELQTAKDDDLDEIANSKQEGFDAIQEKSESCQSELNAVVDDFSTMNDVSESSAICPTIRNVFDAYDFLQQPDMPFIFGILSRYNDYWGVANFTTELGYWYNSSANTMLNLLVGCHTYTNEYAAFYVEPKLCFLQGQKGNFNKKEYYMKYLSTSSQYNYPYSALGCLFVKNKTEEDITSTLNFGGSSYSASYAGASMFVGVPNHTSSAIAWTNVYSYADASSGFSNTANITVPANTTIVVLFYTSSYYYTSSSSYYYCAQFINWRLNSVRSGFLVEGLEIDLEKTWKAWQCPGFTTTYQLFAQS
jgi:hypothetical protein